MDSHSEGASQIPQILYILRTRTVFAISFQNEYPIFFVCHTTMMPLSTFLKIIVVCSTVAALVVARTVKSGGSMSISAGLKGSAARKLLVIPIFAAKGYRETGLVNNIKLQTALTSNIGYDTSLNSNIKLQTALTSNIGYDTSLTNNIKLQTALTSNFGYDTSLTNNIKTQKALTSNTLKPNSAQSIGRSFISNP
jgi:hypothetical protein